MSELAAPSEQWLRVLADHSISIVIVLFMLFAALPAMWVAGNKVTHWVGDRLVDMSVAVKNFMETISESASQSVRTQEEIKSLLAARNTVDHDWHDEKLRKLNAIDTGVQKLHDKVDDLKNHVTKNHGGG